MHNSIMTLSDNTPTTNLRHTSPGTLFELQTGEPAGLQP